MTKSQWDAVYNFCADFGYTRRELLEALKANGTVDQNTKLEELGNYANGKSYDDMYQFLGDNL